MFSLKIKTMDELIIKYIVGETDSEETARVRQWIAEDPGHGKTYEHFLALWEHSRTGTALPEPDMEAAWQRFILKREEAGRQQKRPGRTLAFKNPFRTGIAAAVAVMVMFTAWWAFIRKDNISFETVTASATYTLPDQSVVTLNSQSRLWYQKSFNKKERWVAMKGEAFFDVTRNKEKPFVVSVDDIEVRVLGTSFNIRSDEKTTEIVVETGSVKVSRGGEDYVLSPGEKLVFKGKGVRADVSRVDNHLYRYYRTNMFVCDNTPLGQFAESLSQAYGVQVSIADSRLREQQLTGKFPRTATIEPILETVALTLNATVVKDKNGYILK